MRIVDANVLIYAVNSSSEFHDRARTWLDEALGGVVAVGFDWSAINAFVRVATLPRVMTRPIAVADALEVVDAWLSAPASVVVRPRDGHALRMASLLQSAGAGGNLVNDAHLAALAQSYNGEVVSFDTDFARFPSVRWTIP